MQRSIVHVDVHRTALIVALAVLVVGLVMLVLALPFLLLVGALELHGSALRALTTFGVVAFLLLPLLHLVTTYIFTAIAVLIFNLVAPRVGGLRVRFAEAGPNGP
jgi:hypothetical protein